MNDDDDIDDVVCTQSYVYDSLYLIIQGGTKVGHWLL